MNWRLGRAKTYRHHAEELRTLADNWRDPRTVQQVAQLAQDYDKMADEMELAAKSDSGTPEPRRGGSGPTIRKRRDYRERVKACEI